MGCKAGGGGGGTSPVGGGAGGGWSHVPPAWEEEGAGVVVTPRRLKQLTPGYGELSAMGGLFCLIGLPRLHFSRLSLQPWTFRCSSFLGLVWFLG